MKKTLSTLLAVLAFSLPAMAADSEAPWVMWDSKANTCTDGPDSTPEAAQALAAATVVRSVRLDGDGREVVTEVRGKCKQGKDSAGATYSCNLPQVQGTHLLLVTQNRDFCGRMVTLSAMGANPRGESAK